MTKSYLRERREKCSFYLQPLAVKEVVVKIREMAENSNSLLSITWPAPLAAPRGPKTLSPKPVLGMTLHRKSVQPVGSPRSPPTTSRLWAQTAWIKVTLHSHRAPSSPQAKEPLPPLPPLHPLSQAVSLQGFVTPRYTLHPLSHTHTT